MRAMLLGFVLIVAMAAIAAEDVNKVPDQYAVRLYKVVHDVDTLNVQMAALQRQADSIIATEKHDEEEIAQIKKEALEAAKKDATWDIDTDKMVFVAKVAPPPAAKK